MRERAGLTDFGGRNLFDARDDVDIEVLAMITAYVRRIVSRLGEVDDEVLMSGKVRFGLPTSELDKVNAPSKLFQQVEQKVKMSAESSANMQARSASGP